MEPTYTTLKDGTVLSLKPVPQVGLQNLLLRYNEKLSLKRGKDGGNIEDLKSQIEKQDKTMVANMSFKLFRYIMVTGITTMPSEDDILILDSIGMETHPPVVAKLNWLENFVLDNEDLMPLLKKVMDISFSKPEPQPEPEPKSEEIPE